MQTADHKVKCAIYKHSDLSFIAETEEKTIVVGSAWNTFNFAVPPSVLSGTEYVLVAWAEDVAGNASIPLLTDVANRSHTQALAYAAWPDPLVPAHNVWKASIYCTVQEHNAGTWFETDANGIATWATENDDVIKATVIPTAVVQTANMSYHLASTLLGLTYTKLLVRWKTSVAAAGVKAGVIITYTDLTTETTDLGYSTLWKLTSITPNVAKTIHKVAFTVTSDVGAGSGTFYCYWDFFLIAKGTFTFPNCAGGLEFAPPPKNALLIIPDRITDITQKLGTECATVNIGCDLDIGTWTRAGDYIDGEVFVDISHNSKTEVWQWLDTDSEQFKVTLESPTPQINREAHHILNLYFREYRRSSGSTESYVERFGLNLSSIVPAGGGGSYPALTGDATVADVMSPRTFYNTDPTTKLTGIIAPLTGDAVAGNVMVGKKFYKDDPATQLTGTLALTGDALIGNVMIGKKFYKDDPLTQLTGTLALTGNATVADVVNTKTFYKDDPLTQLTGTHVCAGGVLAEHANAENTDATWDTEIAGASALCVSITNNTAVISRAITTTETCCIVVVATVNRNTPTTGQWQIQRATVNKTLEETVSAANWCATDIHVHMFYATEILAAGTYTYDLVNESGGALDSYGCLIKIVAIED